MASTSVSTSGPTSSAATEAAPTPQQLLFARAVILTFELWPAMRLAVSEEWGGPDSLDKRDYLISHLCDEHGDAAPSCEPDIDDLAETLEGYIADEFECRLDDGSPDWVAGRIVGLHRAIFRHDEETAREAVAQLEKAFAELKGKKTNASAGQDASEIQDDDHDHDHSGDEEMDEDEGARVAAARRLAEAHGGVMAADELGANAGVEQRARREREPRREAVVDEDGFETVVSRRRR
ncbi:rRNA accumulation-related protein [Thecaphora frezii]